MIGSENTGEVISISEGKSLTESYTSHIKREYARLASRRNTGAGATGLEEVKLRLFLALLDKPVTEEAELTQDMPMLMAGNHS